jgi:hypothetical protein
MSKLQFTPTLSSLGDYLPPIAINRSIYSDYQILCRASNKCRGVGMIREAIICTYEDRLPALAGVELLARSLKRFNPRWRLTVWSPYQREAVTGLSEDDVEWRTTTELVGSGWNVKPTILLRGLREARRAMWFDSDIIVIGPIERIFGKDEQNLLVSQEFRDSGKMGSQLRVLSWGWPLERTLPFHVNSGAILATHHHAALLTEWERTLRSPEYQKAQALLPVTARPLHMLGDQDVLWALLCSRFAAVPVEFLRNGVDVVQDSGANGFHVLDRLRNIWRSEIMFVHALGKTKPWQFGEQSAQLSYMRSVTYEVSPYFIAASQYSQIIRRATWLRRHTTLAKLLAGMMGGGMATSGLPLALIALLAATRQPWKQ